MSASHIIQAGNDLFIGKTEACTMNRRKMENSLLRKEENVYVVDLFVKVPPSAITPSKYKPMEVDAIKSQMEKSNGDESRSTATAQLFDDRRSERGRQVRTEYVRPQFDECCERQRECDSVLSATSDKNDAELNGETVAMS